MKLNSFFYKKLDVIFVYGKFFHHKEAFFCDDLKI